MSDWCLPLLAKSTVLLAAASLCTMVMRRRSASARHGVWTAAMAALLVLPAMFLTLPRWRVAVLPPAPETPASVVAAAAPSDVPRPDVESPAFSEAPPIRGASVPRRQLVDWRSMAVVLWIGGVVVGLLRSLSGTLFVWRTVRAAAPIDDEDWRCHLAEAAGRLGVRRRVEMRRSATVAVPMVWGVRRPVVLIPSDADLWPYGRRRAFLLHELAHVARHDCLTQNLASIVEALYWPQPLMWWAVRRLRREAERACDDRVLAAGTEAPAYAHHLLEAARRLRDAPSQLGYGSAVVERTNLADRLIALLDERINRRALTWRGLAFGSAVALAATGGVAVLQPVARAAVVEAIRAAAAVAAPTASPTPTAGSAPAAPRPLAPKEAPALVGRVQGPDGKPIANALVVAWEAKRPMSDAASLVGRTDSSGTFRIAALDASAYRVFVHAPPLAPVTVDAVARSVVTVNLGRGGSIDGRVFDGVTRRPVGGARVRVQVAPRMPSVASEPEAGVVSATTDAQGRYRLSGLSSDTRAVAAVAAGYAFAVAQISAGANTADLFLYPGTTIGGTVRGVDGRPVGGVAVSADGEAGGGLLAPVVTDAQGRFELIGATPGVYRLLARHPDWAPAFVPGVEVPASGGPRVEIPFDRGYRVTGRLLGADDRPARGRVVVQVIAGSEVPLMVAQQLSAEARADGLFQIERVPSGDHTLGIIASGYGPTHVDVTVGGKQAVVDVGDLKLDAGAVVHGLVRDEKGAAIANADVTTFTSRQSRTARSEADGSFVLAGLEPNAAYKITVSAEKYALAEMECRAGGPPIDVTLAEEGVVSGAVVDAAGRPVTGFVAVLRQNNPSGTSRRDSNDDGRFRIERVKAGTYALEIQAEEMLDKKLPDVKVVSGRATDVGRIVLEPGGRVNGVVVDGGGAPIPGAVVDAQKRMNNFISPPRATTDAAGRFELRGLASGATKVRASHPRFAPSADVDVEIDPAEPASARLTLLEGGRVEGTSRRRNGSPIPGALVGAIATGGGARVPVRADGTFLLEHVTPGSRGIYLAVRAGGSYQTILSKQVEVVDGATTAVDLSPREVRVSGRVTRGAKPVSDQTVSFHGGNDGGASYFTLGPRSGVPARAEGVPRMECETRADGSYDVLLPSAGQYRISLKTVLGAGGSPTPDDVVVPDVEQLHHDITLPDWSLIGIVVDKVTGLPLDKAGVVAKPANGSLGSVGATSGPDGRYRFAVTPGMYVVRALAPDYVVQEVPMELGGLPVERTFELVKGTPIKGRVTSAQGQPVDRAMVVALAPDGTSRRTAQTDASGSFTIDGLAAGAYQVYAEHELGFARRTGISPGAEPVGLVLAPGAKVRLRLVDDKGAPVKGSCVRVDVLRLDGLRTGIEGGLGACIGISDGIYDAVLPIGAVELLARTGDKRLRGEVSLGVGAQTPETTITLKSAF